jgi:4-amino-4-deoxy-L-arabinose transferase-like glycosyltransferase
LAHGGLDLLRVASKQQEIAANGQSHEVQSPSRRGISQSIKGLAGSRRSMHDAAEKKRLWEWLPAITLVALTLRLVAVGFLYRHTWNDFENHLLFGFETGRIARSIAAGHGYGNPMFIETGATAWMTPVYPYLLAGVFKLFGIYSRTSALVILSLNALFSALICVPAFFIAQRSFGRRVAVVACWLWALLPYSIYISGSFVWETCLSALLLALLFLSAIKLKEHSTSWRWLGFGVLWGFSALSNASILLLLPFLACWALYPLWRNWRKWIVAAALAAIGLGIALLPWQVRNYRTFHEAIPLRDDFWAAVWVGNDGYTESWGDWKAHPSVNKEEMAQFVRLGEISYMREKRRQALGFIAGHPRLYLVLCLRRFVYTWTAFWNLDPRNLAIELYDPASVFLTVPLTVLMLVGLWQAFRIAREAALPFLFVLVFYPLLFYLTHAEIRYRHLIDPEIVILAAMGARFLFLEAKAVLLTNSRGTPVRGLPGLPTSCHALR